MGGEGPASGRQADYTVPLLFLVAYGVLLLVLRFLSSYLWSSDESTWLSSLFSFISSALTGCAIFSLGYYSYRYLMPPSGRSSRKKRALGASARVGRQQAAAVLAALTESDPKQLNQEENLMTLIDEVTIKIQGLEMALSHLSPSVSEETKKRVSQFVTYIHSIQSPWAEEERQKSSEEKAKLLALLCDTDPFATIKKDKSGKETDIEEQTEGHDDSREYPASRDESTSEADDVENAEEEERKKEDGIQGSSDTDHSTGGGLGFDLSGLGDFQSYGASDAEGSEENSGSSSAANDLMAALQGGTSQQSTPYEFGSEFAGLTDLGDLTKSLGAALDFSKEGEEERDVDSSPREGSHAGEAQEVEEEDEWAALEEEFHNEANGEVEEAPKRRKSSAKDDLLGALGALEGLAGGEGEGEIEGGKSSGFSLGDVDLSALSAFATTSGSSMDVDAVDLSALDGFAGTAQPRDDESYGDLSDLLVSSQAPSVSAHTKTDGAKALSYDDFFSAIQSKKESPPPSESAATPTATPAGQLVRGFGSKEDMNLSGMKRSKKKAVRWGPAGKGKPVYQMEDTHYAGYPFSGSEEMALFGVFDGHVGKNAAERAKVLFPEEFAKNLRGHEEETDMSHVLRKTFLSTDAKMIEYDMEGATATGVYIWKVAGRRYIQAANVGDSTAFLCRNGKAIWLSVDHKVNDPDEKERLIKAGMQLSEGQSRINGLAVSRALGDHFVKEHYPVTAEPFVSEPFELGDGDDKLIVASDGLWDIVSGQEALEIVKDMTDPMAMAAKLTETAVRSRLCNDNVTVIVVLL